MSNTVPNRSFLLQSIIIAGIGAAFYAVLISGIMLAPDAFPEGIMAYDEYFLAIIDGHLDVPPRIAQLEGHYLPDGTAYFYYGIAPLLTRFVLGWVWPFETLQMVRLSIWFWACAGTACYHAAFFLVAKPHLAKLGENSGLLVRLLGLTIWFGSAGILVSANSSMYHEPISVSYTAAGAFILVSVLGLRKKISCGTALILMATCAAVALHARPNVAVGLYLGTVVAVGLAASKSLQRAWIPACLSMALLGASGLAYLGLNAIKFGSPTEVHGSFDKGSIQYGFVFWGFEDENSERAQAFKEHGKFNLRRIPHNTALYFFDLPDITPTFQKTGEKFRSWAKETLAVDLGFIRVEVPTIGLVFLWPFWLALALSALSGGLQPIKYMGVPLVASLTTFLLTLAYGTITLRYRIDLWPFIAVVALIGMNNLLPKLVARHLSRLHQTVLGTALVLGLLTSALMGGAYQNSFTNNKTSPVWPYDICQYLSTQKGFTETDVKRICRPPRSQAS